MSDVTQILKQIAEGDQNASNLLLPLVYDELRRLASLRLAHELPGQTLQATALVHEAYLRLVRADDAGWHGSGHFFAAAAEAMRRILVENARRKHRLRYGGGRQRLDLDQVEVVDDLPCEQILALDDALERLAANDPLAARVVSLRYFAGLSMKETAAVLQISPRTAERNWTYARTWLHRELSEEDSSLT
jgi:RNA polymerase sigma factor (TIGR02999 family)